jgi:quinol monooxygenase YgiN
MDLVSTPVFVVATATPRPGRLNDIVDAYAQVTPAVHAEAGCELYAVHSDDEVVIIVERWTSQSDLNAHAVGEPLIELKRLLGDSLAAPIEVRVLGSHVFGDPAKGELGV